MKEAQAGSRADVSRGLQGDVATSASLVAVTATNTGGANQAGVRLYNERLLLSLVRRFGPLSKIEVARLTGLSVQSTSAIMNRLQADGLLKREAPLRGRVGQPTIPMSIDPEGAYSFGLKIGRRSLRSRADRFPRRHSPSRAPRVCLSDANHDPGFCARIAAVARRIPSPQRKSGGSRASASRGPSSCGAGRPRSARRPAP